MTDTLTRQSTTQKKINKSRPKPQRFSRKWWRDQFFVLHRYAGLVVGIFAVIIGVTGSLLVFRKELEPTLNPALWYVPPQQGELASINTIIDKVIAAYPDDKFAYIDQVFTGRSLDFWLTTPAEKTRHVFVNQYTGEILGSYAGGFFDQVIELHYNLLAGAKGTAIMGVAAGLLFLLCVTGLVLWPGWRKLATGFSIKWNARRQRLNFDLHKVFGITMAIFISLTAFTGFCWNFAEQTDPILHALAGAEEEAEIVSTPVPGKKPIDAKVAYASLVAEGDRILPGGILTSFGVPTTETETYSVWKRMPGDFDKYYGDHILYFDQYSGKLIKSDDAQANKAEMSFGEYVLDSFDEVHYGTFWGIPSRILYIFVGLSIPGLFITSLVMYGSKVLKQKKL
jgi:uncharacterized iron-regulated membrane protein